MKKKKRKYRKLNKAFWSSRSANAKALVEKEDNASTASNNEQLLGLILQGVTRLSQHDKDIVLAYALGKRKVTDNELWAIKKIVKG